MKNWKMIALVLTVTGLGALPDIGPVLLQGYARGVTTKVPLKDGSSASTKAALEKMAQKAIDDRLGYW